MIAALALAAWSADVAAVQRHALEVAQRAPDGFTVVVEGSFVIAGDEAPEQVKRRARTVAWATRELREAYFAQDPEQVWEIWLFDGATSYEEHAWSLFGDRPDTPYGYASSRHHALVMNIATGGGTLIHELVHPYIATDFPAVPSWLNEGLASLYEQASSRDGDIVGLVNWRLPALQAALARGEEAGLAQVLALDDEGFYGTGSGMHYAKARYLCMYLQERGELRAFYTAFREAHPKDRTGLATVLSVTGHADRAELEASWVEWVRGLEV